MKFKIQVITTSPFKDEIEVDLSEIFPETKLSKIKYNIFKDAKSEIGIANYFSDIIISRLENFIYD